MVAFTFYHLFQFCPIILIDKNYYSTNTKVSELSVIISIKFFSVQNGTKSTAHSDLDFSYLNFGISVFVIYQLLGQNLKKIDPGGREKNKI